MHMSEGTFSHITAHYFAGFSNANNLFFFSIIIISSPEQRLRMSYCDHLPSVVHLLVSLFVRRSHL